MQVFYCSMLWVIMVSAPVYGAQTMTGDVTNAETSFSFPILAHAYNQTTGVFAIGASQTTTGTAAGYALAMAGPRDAAFTPLTGAQRVTLNGVADQQNPLYGAAIQNLALMTTHPVVSLVNDPTSLYILQSSESGKESVLSVTSLVDGQETPASSGGIIALTTNTFSGDVGGLRNGMAAYAAVRKNGGVFGGDGGGIAIAKIVEQNPGAVQLVNTGTIPLNPTTATVKIGSDLTSMADYVTFCRDIQVPLIYVGLQVVGGSGANDGAYGVIALSSDPATPQFSRIVAESAVQADSIIAATGPSAAVTIFKIGNMFTTTQLRYLIVVGGTSGTPARQVYALPQVSQTGALAKKNAVPVLKFSKQYPHIIETRQLVDDAVAPGDLYTSTDVAAQVGGGLAPVASITELVVSGDTVFIAGAEGATQQPGIFYSQALFDGNGCIKGFTAWQRAGGATGSVFGSALDARTGNFWYMPGSTSSTVTTVKRTLWDKATTGFTGLVNTQFDAVEGGVQGLVDFSSSTDSFTTSTATALAVTAVTGYQKVLLAQTGGVSGGLFGPVTNFSGIFTSEDGSLKDFASGVAALSFTGGDLASLGAIVTTAVVTDGTYGWFVVGGVGGLAVLAHDDGTGFLATPGLRSGFVGLDATMRWRKIGSFGAIRKLTGYSCGGINNLYILTNTSCERLSVSPATFAVGAAVSSNILAAAGQLPQGSNTYFSDMIVSLRLVLLATSSGLFRNGNNTDVRTAVTASDLDWTPVVMQESLGPVSRLYAVTQSGDETDLLSPSGLSGNLYVLNSYVGYHQARVYRFTMSYTGAISDSTMQPFPDYIVEGKKTFFLNIGAYRNYLATDGAIFALSRSKYIVAPMFVEVLGAEWKNRLLTERASRQPFDSAIRVVSDPQATSVGRMLRSTGIGSWLVPADTGMFSNE